MKKINQKSTYTSPEVELLVVRSEGVVCTSEPEFNSTHKTETFINNGEDDI